MSKTSLALLFLLLVFVACFFIITFSSSLVSLSQINRPDPPIADTTSQSADTTIAFTQSSQQVAPSQESTVGLRIETDEDLAVAQVEISYNPALITILDITPGKYFIGPIELIKNINPDNGRISYALTCSAPKNEPTGQECINRQTQDFATIRYIPRATASQQTALSLMPKTLVQKGNTNHPVKRGDALTILIRGTSSEKASQSATVTETIPTN